MCFTCFNQFQIILNSDCQAVLGSEEMKIDSPQHIVQDCPTLHKECNHLFGGTVLLLLLWRRILVSVHTHEAASGIL